MKVLETEKPDSELCPITSAVKWPGCQTAIHSALFLIYVVFVLAYLELTVDGK